MAKSKKIEKLKLLNKLTAKSKATEKDVMELSRKIKAGMARRYGRSSRR